MRNLLLSLVLVILAGIGIWGFSAGQSSSAGPETLYRISSEGDPDTIAADMSRILTPADAAAAFVVWLGESQLDDRDFNRALAARLARSYSDGGRQQFLGAVDSLQHAAPVALQAHMLAVAAAPRMVGRALGIDTTLSSVEAEKMVQMVEAEYASRPQERTEFRRAFAWHRFRLRN